jgi:hypothetical protein
MLSFGTWILQDDVAIYVVSNVSDFHTLAGLVSEKNGLWTYAYVWQPCWITFGNTLI